MCYAGCFGRGPSAEGLLARDKMRMWRDRVDLQHLLEDLRDAYTGALEETILTEAVANAFRRPCGAERGARLTLNAFEEATRMWQYVPSPFRR